MAKKGNMRIKENGQIVNYYPSTTYDMVMDEQGGSLSTDIPLLKTFKTAAETKLNGIATGATKTQNSTTNGNIKINDVETNIYTHPTLSGNKHIPSGGSAGQILRWSTDGTAVWGADNNTTYSIATQSANGLMSSTDKTKLDGIETGATKTILNNTVTSTSATEAATASAVKTAYDKANHSHPYAPTSHGNHVPTTQTASNDVFLRNDNSWATVTPANIGAAKRSVVSDTETFINEPVAHFKSGASALTGTIKITLPKSWTNTMVSFDIICYDYSSNGRYIYHISGYNYSTGPAWTNAQFSTEGNPKTTNVRFGHDGTKCCVLLGTTASTWAYPSFTITNVKAGHSAGTGWETGWDISTITSETTITNIVSGTNTTWSNLPTGTTSVKGIVQLSSATNSTSTSTAATSSAVKAAYDLAASKASTSVATQSTNGLMSSTDKTKLDGVEANANNYSHPITSGNNHIPTGGSSGQILRWSADGTAVWGSDNNTTYSVATTTSNGLMSSTDKSKLDGIAANANNYSHPTGDGNSHIPANGTSNTGKYLQATATAGTYQWTTLPTASTSVVGIVQLNSATNSTSTTTAATASAVKAAYDLAASKAASTHTHNYAGSSSAGGAATTALVCTGNSATATKLATARTIALTGSVTGSGTFDGSGNLSITTSTNHNHTIDNVTDMAVGTCSTTASTVAKVVTVTNFTLRTGAIALIKFTLGSTVASPTLNINSTGAKPIFYNGVAAPADLINANDLIIFMYDGTNWVVNGVLDYGTTTTSSSYGGTASAGTSSKVSREDHKHALPALPTASTSASGIVQLNSATNSTSTTTAATASAVKAAYDLAASKSASTHTHNYAGSSSAGGVANSAVILSTARTINGTSFNGSANITTANWGTARTLTIGNSEKSVNGSANVSWSLDEIGAAPGATMFATTAATAQWYRIAKTISTDQGVPMGQFNIKSTVAGKHSATIITAGLTFGTNPTLNQLMHTQYGTTGISKVRIVYHTTYSGNTAYIEVYVPDATARTLEVRMYGSTGWALMAPNTVGAVPTGYIDTEITLVPGKIVSDINGTVNGYSIDKSVPTNAIFTDTVYTHPTSDGNKHVPANGTSNNGKYLQATATAGTYQWASLPTSTTSVAGIVQLNSAINSTSTTLAATASAVKTAYDKANHSHPYFSTSGGTISGSVKATSGFVSTAADGVRIAYGTYGFFIRNDGNSTYFMNTNSGDINGSYNSLRPLAITNSNGNVTMGHNVGIQGQLTLGNSYGNIRRTSMSTAAPSGGANGDVWIKYT